MCVCHIKLHKTRMRAGREASSRSSSSCPAHVVVVSHLLLGEAASDGPGLLGPQVQGQEGLQAQHNTAQHSTAHSRVELLLQCIIIRIPPASKPIMCCNYDATGRFAGFQLRIGNGSCQLLAGSCLAACSQPEPPVCCPSTPPSLPCLCSAGAALINHIAVLLQDTTSWAPYSPADKGPPQPKVPEAACCLPRQANSKLLQCSNQPHPP